MVRGLFLCLENRKKGRKRAKCEKTNIFRYKKRGDRRNSQPQVHSADMHRYLFIIIYHSLILNQEILLI